MGHWVTMATAARAVAMDTLASIVVAGQRQWLVSHGVHAVLLTPIAVVILLGLGGLSLEHRPVVVGECHGEQCVRITHKLVHVSLAGHFLHDSFLIVVAQRATQLVIVHGWPVLLDAPAARHLHTHNIIYTCHNASS